MRKLICAASVALACCVLSAVPAAETYRATVFGTTCSGQAVRQTHVVKTKRIHGKASCAQSARRVTRARSCAGGL